MKIEVKFEVNTDIKTAVRDMKGLANRLDMRVFTNFNGVEVSVWKGSEVDNEINEYHRAVGNKTVLVDLEKTK